MSTALQAYRHVAASDEFKEIERMRSKARHDEAQALNNAKRQGEAVGMEKMIITALQDNASQSLIESMRKNAGITESRLGELKKQIKTI